MEGKDPFRDLAFDGKPSNYREFRRKVILSVAALEDKSQHLAGPKLLSRLTGEAWRCTEHLSVSELRTSHGWTKVLECLDKHYQHLPEIELHEAIDEFLFHLKKRPHEGATAFSSRFRTQLARLEHLITQERAAAQVKRRKIQPDGKHILGQPHQWQVRWKILQTIKVTRMKKKQTRPMVETRRRSQNKLLKPSNLVPSIHRSHRGTVRRLLQKNRLREDPNDRLQERGRPIKNVPCWKCKEFWGHWNPHTGSPNRFFHSQFLAICLCGSLD